jgi:hypothetical protein
MVLLNPPIIAAFSADASIVFDLPAKTTDCSALAKLSIPPIAAEYLPFARI